MKNNNTEVTQGDVNDFVYDIALRLAAFNKGNLNLEETAALFQMLMNSGMIAGVPAVYRHAAEELVKAGLVKRPFKQQVSA